MNNLNTSTETYFANKTGADLLTDLMGKVEDYYKYLTTSGRIDVWRRSYEFYYRGYLRGARVNRAGAQNEYYLLNVNHFRNLLQHLKNMTTQQLPALIPQAANTDYESMAQTIVASGILDYYLSEKDIATYADIAIEDVLVFGEGEVELIWDTELGEDFAADNETGRIYRTGDIALKNYTPLDVVRDWLQPSAQHHTWKITRDFVSKHDLAIKYPLHERDILDKDIGGTEQYRVRLGYSGKNETDLIPRFRFYHERTPSVPQGRIVEFLDAELELFSGPLPYETIPLHRASASDQRGTPFATSVAFDLLPLQEAVDGIVSTIMTNQSQYGVQNIWSPIGNGTTVSQLSGGLNLITGKVKPEGINLTNTPAEIFSFLEHLVKDMETISGVNSVARGNPEASLKSGAALALVQSMAIQFNSGLQKTYAKLWSDIGTGIISHLKTFPMTKRNIVISGKNNRSYMIEYEKDQMKDVKRVTVDLGNPLSRTTAGKVNMADNLLERGLIKEPEQYIEVMTTGKLEPTYEGPQAEKMLVRSENESLIDGEEVIAIITDPHAMHINEHKVVIASPEARKNANVVGATLKHIQQHIDLLRSGDPALLQAIGQQPIAPQQPTMTPQSTSAQGALPEGSPVATGEGSQPGPGSPVEAEASAVKQPNMPTNPLTGEKYNNVTGGLTQ